MSFSNVSWFYGWTVCYGARLPQGYVQANLLTRKFPTPFLFSSSQQFCPRRLLLSPVHDVRAFFSWSSLCTAAPPSFHLSIKDDGKLRCFLAGTIFERYPIASIDLVHAASLDRLFYESATKNAECRLNVARSRRDEGNLGRSFKIHCLSKTLTRRTNEK